MQDRGGLAVAREAEAVLAIGVAVAHAGDVAASADGAADAHYRCLRASVTFLEVVATEGGPERSEALVLPGVALFVAT